MNNFGATSDVRYGGTADDRLQMAIQSHPKTVTVTPEQHNRLLSTTTIIDSRKFSVSRQVIHPTAPAPQPITAASTTTTTTTTTIDSVYKKYRSIQRTTTTVTTTTTAMVKPQASPSVEPYRPHLPTLRSLRTRSILNAAPHTEVIPVVKDILSHPQLEWNYLVPEADTPTNPAGLTLSTQQENLLDRLENMPVLLSLKEQDGRARR